MVIQSPSYLSQPLTVGTIQADPWYKVIITPQYRFFISKYCRASSKSSAELAQVAFPILQVMAYGLPDRFRNCVVRSSSLPGSPPMVLLSPRTFHAARCKMQCTWIVVYEIEKVQRRLWKMHLHYIRRDENRKSLHFSKNIFFFVRQYLLDCRESNR